MLHGLLGIRRKELDCSQKTLEKRGKRLLRKLKETVGERAEITLKRDVSQVGGGALPLQELPTLVLGIKPHDISAEDFEEDLRRGDPPILARISKDELILDMRTVFDEEIPLLAQGLEKALVSPLANESF